MKNIYLTIMVLAATLVLSGCSPFTLVSSETYNNADLADYKTFRIVTPDQGELPKGMEMVTYYNIAAAIREQMVARGFTEDSSSPLLINFAVTVRREISTAPAYTAYPPFALGPGPLGGYYRSFIYPRYYYWNPNAQVITGIYQEGVLTVDMIDIDRKLPLFSASVATIINGGQGRYRNLSQIAEAVNKLYSRFPGPLLPQYKNKKTAYDNTPEAYL